MFIGIAISIRSQLKSSTAAFSPASLFAAFEPGVWYDPSDLTTLFTDIAGTTPVTATGQTVALMLDKSKGLALGSELVTNGNFSNGSTGWSSSTGDWSIGGGVATYSGSANSNLFTTPSIVVSGKWYELSFSVVSGSGATISPYLVNQGQATSATTFSNVGVGSYRCVLLAPTSGQIGLRRQGGTGFSVDNISVKELEGNHATQATTASRPIYGINPITGTRNFLVWSEDLTNATWTKTNATVTSNATIAPDGLLTADLLTGTGAGFVAVTQGMASLGFRLSYFVKANTETKCEIWPAGSSSAARFDLAAKTATNTNGSGAAIEELSNGWFRISVLASVGGNNRLILGHGGPTLSTSMYIWGAQQEAGALSAYQRVTDQYNVTEAGVASAHYLRFDGVDDFMVTNTITPAIDKAQVFTGVRKLSDATGAMIAEFSTNANSATGALRLTPGNSASGSGAFYSAASRGTALADVDSAGTFAAPITNIVSFIGEIAADICRLRLNGTQVAQATTDQGTGNYLAYPLYIGRRAGTSFPFNGQIYSLIVRFGANLTAGQITSTETYVNGKTGAYS